MAVISRFGLPGLVLVIAAVLALSASESAVSSDQATPSVTHGVVVGDVTARSAVLWARADRAATLNVTLSGGGHGPVPRLDVRAADDFTGHVRLEGLHPATTYDYRVWFSLSAPGRARGPVARGSFRTAPADGAAAGVRLAFGGDVAGQNVCRDTEEGFPIMDTIRSWRPDVFVGLGDVIYADNACETFGRYGNGQVGDLGIAVDAPGFWAHWRSTVPTEGPRGCSERRATSESGTTTRS
jgi:alkaline phosphatase D